MESVNEALDRALVDQTIEAWDRVDNAAYKEVSEGHFSADKLRRFFKLALKRRGYDPEDEAAHEFRWIDNLIAKSLHHMENCALMRAQFTAFQGVMHSIDRTGRLIAVTQSWLDMLGYEMKDVLGRLSSDFLTEESRRRAIEEALPRFWKEGFIREYPYQMVTSDGTVLDVRFSTVCARDDAGRPTNSICIIDRDHIKN